MMPITLNPDKLNLSPGAEVILRPSTWSDYETLLNIRHPHTLPKIYFNAITQEIRLMTPLPGHGNRTDTLRDLVKILLRHQGQDWHCFDPITLKKFGQAGLEPDTCFYIANRQAVLGKEKIDLDKDPPPDLALEIDLTSSTKPEDYQPLALPELWIYRRSGLFIYLWDGQEYQESQTSLIFPEFAVKSLLPKYVELAWSEGSSVALRAFEAYLQKKSC